MLRVGGVTVDDVNWYSSSLSKILKIGTTQLAHSSVFPPHRLFEVDTFPC